MLPQTIFLMQTVNGNITLTTPFCRLCLQVVVYVPQLFYLQRHGEVVLIVKVTDEITVGGAEANRRWFNDSLSATYDIRTITHMPGSFLFFGCLFT